MPDSVMKCLEDMKKHCGVSIPTEMAEKVYRYCQRKMEVAGIEAKEAYISYLYPDELKRHLERLSITMKGATNYVYGM